MSQLFTSIHIVKGCLLLVSISVQQIKGGNQCLKCSMNLEGISPPYEGINDQDQCYFIGDKTPAKICSENQYCLTTIILKQGLPVNLNRGCQSVSHDFDEATDQCATTINLNSEQTTTSCYYPCNDTAKCNDVSFDKVKQCPGNCSSNDTVTHGFCDYITGNCNCLPYYSGNNCETYTEPPTARPVSCIQCNEETDDKCVGESLLEGVPCQSSRHKYCAVSQTQTLDSDRTFCSERNVIRSIVTRGCTSSLTHVDECFFSKPSDAHLPRYTEFTCTSTCEGNNCNTGIPDGLANKALYCHECSGTNCGSSFKSRTLCPLDSTHCYSSVEYYITDRVDSYEQENPGYQLIKIERGCATSSLVRGCTVEDLNGAIKGAKRVVCQESCQEDGCNDGWPARPRCHQCSFENLASSRASDCMLSQSTESCPMPYHEFCVVVETKHDTSVPFYSNYELSVNRSCSYKGIGNSCHVTTVDSVSVKQCNRTCSTDGCNIGLFNSASIHQIKYRTVAVLGLLASLFSIKQQ